MAEMLPFRPGPGDFWVGADLIINALICDQTREWVVEAALEKKELNDVLHELAVLMRAITREVDHLERPR